MNEKPPTIRDTIFESNDGATIAITLKEIVASITFEYCTFKDYSSGSIFETSRS